jgi:hypothetical protein
VVVEHDVLPQVLLQVYHLPLVEGVRLHVGLSNVVLTKVILRRVYDHRSQLRHLRLSRQLLIHHRLLYSEVVE